MTNDNLNQIVSANPQRLANHLGMAYRRGRWFCPFCQSGGAANHLTPDFSMKRGTVRMACFKCGWRGGPVKLVMDLCRLPYKEAAKFIEQVYGMEHVTPRRLATVTRKALTEAKAMSKKKSYPSSVVAKESILRALGDGWMVAGSWRYGEDIEQTRFQKGIEKTYRPVSRQEDGSWVCGLPRKKWPLYGVERL